MEVQMAYCIAVRWTIQTGQEQNVTALATSMVARSNAEPGCDAYILHRDLADPSALFLYEQYTDVGAFEDHCTSEHFRLIVEAQIFPLLSDRRLEIYETV